jgi:hypothetical protein
MCLTRFSLPLSMVLLPGLFVSAAACVNKAAEPVLDAGSSLEPVPAPSNAPATPLLYALVRGPAPASGLLAGNGEEKLDAGSALAPVFEVLASDPEGFSSAPPCFARARYPELVGPGGLGPAFGLCATPIPSTGGTTPIDAEWRLPRTPQAFVWESGVDEGEFLAFEIRDQSRRPWPGSLRKMRERDRLIAEVRLKEALTPGQKFKVWVSFGLDGGVKTYETDLVVADGPVKAPSWKQGSRSKTKKRRRRRKKR